VKRACDDQGAVRSMTRDKAWVIGTAAFPKPKAKTDQLRARGWQSGNVQLPHPVLRRPRQPQHARHARVAQAVNEKAGRVHACSILQVWKSKGIRHAIIRDKGSTRQGSLPGRYLAGRNCRRAVSLEWSVCAAWTACCAC